MKNYVLGLSLCLFPQAQQSFKLIAIHDELTHAEKKSFNIHAHIIGYLWPVQPVAYIYSPTGSYKKTESCM